MTLPTPSFYTSVLAEAEVEAVPSTLGIDSMAEDLTLLRSVLRALMRQWPVNLPLVLRGMDTLFRGIAIRNRISGKSDDIALKGALAVLDDIRNTMAGDS